MALDPEAVVVVMGGVAVRLEEEIVCRGESLPQVGLAALLRKSLILALTRAWGERVGTVVVLVWARAAYCSEAEVLPSFSYEQIAVGSLRILAVQTGVQEDRGSQRRDPSISSFERRVVMNAAKRYRQP
jgi:hypothetical protein